MFLALLEALVEQLDRESRIIFIHDELIYEIQEHSEHGYEYNIFESMNSEPLDGGVICHISSRDMILETIEKK
jgi:hypothetical protein